ncbi:WD40/YVTN/BNR-like repeat-containing protein [Hymenobacter cellulosivorans]|uniref:Exo-alpha-sialidase n=1 Tax=Hymenobacter cellulosivorans TaxID=2932249 RepID=A0ABY4F7T3_9BACT|nr:hypothetical protein [Hymenobacter cellulosivorans]UOQ52167.1 hypothetical protein MUN80_20690 [Hymenobacter cellulosivorans]
MSKLFIPWLLASGLLVVAACKKDPASPQDPPVAQTAKLTMVRGDKQTGPYGADLPDSLVLKVTPAAGETAQDYVVTYKMRVGNGTVMMPAYPYSIGNRLSVDRKGLTRTRWSLGCNASQQKVTFYLSAPSCLGGQCPPLDSVSFTATAQRPTGWSRACGATPGGISTSFCNCGPGLYALFNDQPYVSADQGVNWQPLTVPVANDRVRFLKCNSRGVLYALLENSGIYTSTDKGTTWKAINNGILDHRYPLTLLVEDNALFVSFSFDGLYRTTNNGGFWRKQLLDGKYYEEYSFLTRHPNGSLYVFDKWSALFKSTDNGDNWQKQTTSRQYISSPTYDMTVDNAGNLVVASGYDGYVSTLSPTTLTGNVTSFYTPQTHTTCRVDHLTPYQNKLYFTVDGNLVPGVYAGTPGNYTLASTGFTKPISGFHVRDDGSLLLASHDGLYYFSR